MPVCPRPTEYRRWRRIILLGVMAQVLLFAVVACDNREKPKARPKPLFAVRVASVTKQKIRPSVTLVGTVEPWKRSLVAGEVAGRVEQFPVKEGQSVKKGQLLAQLSTETLQIQLDSAKASRSETRVRHEQAQLDLERIKGLLKKGYLTQKEYDDAVSEELALKQRLTRLDAEIRREEDRIKKSRIVTPFAGLVVKEHTEIGQWVDEGGPVVEMVDISRVKIEVPLPERYVRDVGSGDAVSAVFDGLPGFKAKGRIFSVVAQANMAARTFPVKVKIQNRGLKIKSGMVSRVTILLGKPYEAVLVPKDALVLRGQQQFIFLVEDGKAVQKRVTPGAFIDGLVEVNGEVPEGMRVVVQGNERLMPGQPVRILN